MTTRNVLGMCLVVLVILTDLWLVGGMKFEQEKMQKTIDVQKEMIYNRDTQIEGYGKIIEEKDFQIEKLRRELSKREVSRGSVRTLTCEVSAYTSDDGVMANGEIVHEGAVACNFLPIGTRVRIDGNIYTVKDRCGIDDCIDIYMDSYSECVEWGRKTMEVEVF